MRINTLNGYDVSLEAGRCKVDNSKFFLNITIHREEHITETFLGDLSGIELNALINHLRNVQFSNNAEENNVAN